MKDLLLFVTVLSIVGLCSSMRAFPTESVEMTEELFQKVNPRILWDETNFLVDMSGRYAHCKYLHQNGPFQVDSKFQMNGQSIGGLRSTYAGEEAHWGAVVKYLEDAMPKWTSNPTYRQQIERADSFGCSVQPGCRDRTRGGRQMSIACLFSPAYDGPPPGDEPTEAQAFTPQQYDLTERLLDLNWDRTFHLENLSGKDTDCGMIGKKDYPFKAAEAENDKNKILGSGTHIAGMFGSSPNVGDTETAMVRILDAWAKSPEGQKVKSNPGVEVGCSLISDCMYSGRMYVVVSCLYSLP